MLPTKQIYIESRFKSSDSASHSDFKIDLPISLRMPEDTGFYIDDVCIPNTWYPISERNNVIAFKYNITVAHYAFVPPGNYSTSNLGIAIVTAMNLSLDGLITNSPFQSSNAAIINKLTFSLVAAAKTRIFQMLTDVEFKAASPTLVVRSMNTTLKTLP